MFRAAVVVHPSYIQQALASDRDSYGDHQDGVGSPGNCWLMLQFVSIKHSCRVYSYGLPQDPLVTNDIDMITHRLQYSRDIRVTGHAPGATEG